MILVTGSAGFIGSHLTETLLKSGELVVGVDNFDPFYDRKIKEKNLSIFSNNKNFSFYELDIRSSDMKKLILEIKPDVIVHLAAMAGVRPSIKEPEKYIDVNVQGTLNILNAVKEYKIDNFVFASSSSVYGGNTKIPYCETDRVDNPVSPYAATKKMCELLIYNYHHLYGIPSSLLRFFTVYGPRQRPEIAIHKFVRHIYNGEVIPMFGDGSSSRDYTYISDIVDGIIATIKNPKSYEIYNIGNSYTISLAELVELIEKVTGIEAKKEFFPFQPGDVMKTWSDIGKLKSKLGYNPKVSIQQGVKNFVEWYNSEFN